MKKTVYPKVQNNEAARQLVCGIFLQAAKDYCRSENTKRRNGILRDLKKNNLYNGITDDLGKHTAEQLELHEAEIADRLGVADDDKEEET